jgi:hypothetical protein
VVVDTRLGAMGTVLAKAGEKPSVVIEVIAFVIFIGIVIGVVAGIAYAIGSVWRTVVGDDERRTTNSWSVCTHALGVQVSSTPPETKW